MVLNYVISGNRSTPNVYPSIPLANALPTRQMQFSVPSDHLATHECQVARSHLQLISLYLEKEHPCPARQLESPDSKSEIRATVTKPPIMPLVTPRYSGPHP